MQLNGRARSPTTRHQSLVTGHASSYRWARFDSCSASMPRRRRLHEPVSPRWTSPARRQSRWSRFEAHCVGRFAVQRRMRIIAAALLTSVAVARRGTAFVTFETGQVRPLALSPDGHTLLVLNTPDARLEIFAINGGDA